MCVCISLVTTDEESRSHQIELSVTDAISKDDDMSRHLSVASFELSQQSHHGISQREHHLLSAVLSG